MKTETADYIQSNSSKFRHSGHLMKITNLNHTCRTDSCAVIFGNVYIVMFIFIYICFADAVKDFQLENFKFFFQFTFKIQTFCSIFTQIQALSSKLLLKFSQFLPRTGLFFQVTSNIRHFLPRYFQDQAFSSKLPPRFTHFLRDVVRSDIFFQELPSYLQG